jgi:hypothetical protein
MTLRRLEIPTVFDLVRDGKEDPLGRLADSPQIFDLVRGGDGGALGN